MALGTALARVYTSLPPGPHPATAHETELAIPRTHRNLAPLLGQVTFDVPQGSERALPAAQRERESACLRPARPAGQAQAAPHHRKERSDRPLCR